MLSNATHSSHLLTSSDVKVSEFSHICRIDFKFLQDSQINDNAVMITSPTYLLVKFLKKSSLRIEARTKHEMSVKACVMIGRLNIFINLFGGEFKSGAPAPPMV